MPTWFPQINGNKIMTQLPYQGANEYDSNAVDMETGSRYSFPRRASGLDGYPTVPLGRFGINFSSITDDEVAALSAFFDTVQGRYGAFRFLDPGGNLVKYSEDFTQADWDKSNGPVTVVGATTDPFGHSLATQLTGAGSNAYINAVVGPSDGGMSGFVLTASAWVMSPDSGAQLLIGFLDESFTLLNYTNFSLTPNVWRRIWNQFVVPDDQVYRVILGGLAQWGAGRTMNIFGVQVAPMKGEGGYVKSPDNYGYHPTCRFDTDVFQRSVTGPNQNQVMLPVVEYFSLPRVVTTLLPNAVSTIPYSATITVTGGTPPYTFAVHSGSLPSGLSLNSSTGEISGTPTTPGTSTFTIRITDAFGNFVDQSYTVIVA